MDIDNLHITFQGESSVAFTRDWDSSPLKSECQVRRAVGGKYLFFVSSRSVTMRGFSFLSLYKSVFIFQFLNVKMYNYGKQNTIVNFIIKKLKKTQFPQKV